ncbi:MAG: 16S rRNA (cytidine(1402)-2'-O)-methyltransferase [Deltaproteobacteria bacterium]|nr:16S rRNA (cytidine(1402)-2'-O)-methyltransferase [Deltaproteobacteria bacterium]
MKEYGRLYVVATPIGNLEDLGERARRILQAVALVAAEDTRQSRKLLSAKGLQARLLSYRQQSHTSARKQIQSRLERGQDVALITDGGTPGISDPGQLLVAEIAAQGFQVVSVPGPCAAVAALAGSGLAGGRFLFAGFPPRKAGALERWAAELSLEVGSVVIYESPRRVGSTVAALARAMGERRAVVVRELSKLHETFDRGTLAELADRYREGTRGEVTLVVEGAPRSDRTGPDPAALGPLVRALRAGRALSAAEVARLLSEVLGADRKATYDLASEVDAG